MPKTYRVKVSNEAGQEVIAESPAEEVSADQWAEKIATLQKEGWQFIKEVGFPEKTFQARVLGPKEIPANYAAQYSLTAVIIEYDWKAKTKLAMVEDANNFLSKAFAIDLFDPVVAQILKAAIEGRKVSLT